MPVFVRPRCPEDLPGLGVDLIEQQPGSRYPFRDPLPIPVEQFLHATDALGAWVAEVDGDVVGHVCHTGPRDGYPGAEQLHAACAQAHGCGVGELSWVSALFVAERARGTGAGRLLLRAVVDGIRSAERHPCLEVLPHHGSARQLYLATGWRDVLRVRPPWLTSAVGDAGPDVHVMVLTQEPGVLPASATTAGMR